MKNVSITLIYLLFTNFPLLAQEEINYYEDGSLKSQGILKEGVRQGQWNFYYPSGKKSAIEEYNSGLLNGKVLYYDTAENLIGSEIWHQDVLIDSAIYFFSNGQIEKKGWYKEGLYHGEWRFFYENGRIKRVGSYIDGLPHGFWIFYNEAGIRIQEGSFEKGNENGEWKFYTEKGDLEYVGSFENGQKKGVWYIISKNGKKKKMKY